MAVTLADKKAETISVINVLETIKRLNGDLNDALQHYKKELDEIEKSEVIERR